MAGCIASGDSRAREPGMLHDSAQEPPEPGSDPIVDLPCRLPTRLDSRCDAGERRVVWTVGREYERIPPSADGSERLILSPSKLPFPLPSIHGTGSIEPDAG